MKRSADELEDYAASSSKKQRLHDGGAGQVGTIDVSDDEIEIL